MLERKTDLLVATYPDDLGGLEPTVQFSALPSRLGQHEDEDTRRTLLIDLTFSDPFAPYELKFDKSDMDKALGEVASTIGLSTEDVTAIRATQAAADPRARTDQGREGRRRRCGRRCHHRRRRLLRRRRSSAGTIGGFMPA